jgi:hypothetical protein
MQKQSNSLPRGPNGKTLSRREVLAGAATVALAAGASRVLGSPAPRKQRGTSTSKVLTNSPLRRYMAASVMLTDGRILVTGGYDQPATGSTPRALNSTMIFDPRTGSWSVAAPMNLSRARHAAVVLSTGKVAVLGGIVTSPTSSVEIYDPSTNKWEVSKPLAQARYDHSAETDGTQIYLLGGSSSTMLSGIEVYAALGADLGV